MIRFFVSLFTGESDVLDVFSEILADRIEPVPFYLNPDG